MATPINVYSKDLAISDAKKASSCLENAISAMSKVDNAVSGWDLYIDAAADGFVFAKSESEVGACLSALRTKQTQLDKLISVLQTGTEKLEDADAGFKNELTDPNLWERLTNAVERAIYSSTIGKVNTVIMGAAWVLSLFGDSKTTTHEQTIEVDPVINNELPVISTGIHLDIHMGGYSMRQGDYNAFTEPYGDNAGCCAMAYAVGLSIVTGNPYEPTQFWYGGITHYDAGHRSGWVSYDPNNIYSSLQEGKPTVLAYIYASSPESQTDADHFVIVVGMREGADINNLKYEDFIVVDPAYGSERMLSESWKFNPDRVTGGFVMS